MRFIEVKRWGLARRPLSASVSCHIMTWKWRESRVNVEQTDSENMCALRVRTITCDKFYVTLSQMILHRALAFCGSSRNNRVSLVGRTRYLKMLTLWLRDFFVVSIEKCLSIFAQMRLYNPLPMCFSPLIDLAFANSRLETTKSSPLSLTGK